MSKRISIEAKVVEFFETVDLPVVEAVLGIVQRKVKNRRLSELIPSEEPPKPKRKRRTKAQMAAEAQKALFSASKGPEPD
jgi:GH25 family lysozyme M1 (1,4-beta-N-acetylmuramidase)